MNAYEIIKFIIALGLAAGGIFYIVKEKSRLGFKFAEAFAMAGQMFLSIAGIMTIIPVIGNLIAPLIAPFFSRIGIDPSVLSIFFCVDMGGYSLAQSLSQNIDIVNMMGLAPAAMLGGTLTFSIPVSKKILSDEDFAYCSKGFILGIITIPAGSIAGGLIQGLSAKTVLINNLLLIIIAALLALGFKFIPNGLVKGADIFGKIITKVGLIGLVAGGFTYLTGITIIPGMADIMEAMTTVAGMVLTLAGTLPILELISLALKRPFGWIGKKAGLDRISMNGLLFTLASGIPTFAMMKNMKKRGIIINAAWNVACMGLLGSQLGFVLKEAEQMIIPFAAAKLISGALALAIAFIATSKGRMVKEPLAAADLQASDCQSVQDNEEPCTRR